ncbi:MAG: hypothetical protein V7L14_09120 [Nostoc sp.]|uniref:hypothetical protein n=1 Tax=Nostoc sp. TaxID=1180 RepID=UPI002FFAB758
MPSDETIYKIWQQIKQLQFTSEHLAGDCQIRGKDWEDIKDTFKEVTRLYKLVEALFLVEEQKEDSWKE